MTYTCYEMIRDCRADRAEGWRYFLSQYVPVIRKLLAHYQAGAADETLARILMAVRRPESGLLQQEEPERSFVARLRGVVLRELPAPEPTMPIELPVLAQALEPFTIVEKQTVWLETMGYSPAETAVLLRMAPATVEKIRTKGRDSLRALVDSWNVRLLEENGRALGMAAAAAASPECLPAKLFLDLLDGRTTWLGRDRMERHVTGCWHCVDHFCRLVEAVELLRAIEPLGDAETARFCEILGVAIEKPPVWKRWLSGGSSK